MQREASHDSLTRPLSRGSRVLPRKCTFVHVASLGGRDYVSTDTAKTQQLTPQAT